jgi:hypothetical protein
MLRIKLFAVLFIFPALLSAQTIDNYGLRTGVGFSAHSRFDAYDSNGNTIEEAYRTPFKMNFAIYAYAEKKLNEHFSFKPELGYTRKGFKDFISTTNSQGYVAKKIDVGIHTHHLTFNTNFNIAPFNNKSIPYLIVGLRTDYLVKSKVIPFTHDGTTYNDYLLHANDFNKLTLSGALGIGFQVNNAFYFEGIFNPQLTNVYKNELIVINDVYAELTFRANINALFNKE